MCESGLEFPATSAQAVAANKIMAILYTYDYHNNMPIDTGLAAFQLIIMFKQITNIMIISFLIEIKAVNKINPNNDNNTY